MHSIRIQVIIDTNMPRHEMIHETMGLINRTRERIKC